MACTSLKELTARPGLRLYVLGLLVPGANESSSGYDELACECDIHVLKSHIICDAEILVVVLISHLTGRLECLFADSREHRTWLELLAS